MFLAYLWQGRFVAADMAPKLLQMGFVRARRDSSYRGVRRYDPADKYPLERGAGDRGAHVGDVECAVHHHLPYMSRHRCRCRRRKSRSGSRRRPGTDSPVRRDDLTVSMSLPG
jgi:hypothetical protein